MKHPPYAKVFEYLLPDSGVLCAMMEPAGSIVSIEEQYHWGQGWTLL